jgi:acyl carrier protein
MNEKEAFDTVLALIRPFVRNAENFRRADSSTRIWEDLQVNSSRFIDILLAIEETFDLEIDVDRFEGATTVGDVARLLVEFTREIPGAAEIAREKLKGLPPSRLAP